jgi:hypothetical protein
MVEKLLAEAKKNFEKGLVSGRDPVELFEEIVRNFFLINVFRRQIHEDDYGSADNKYLSKKDKEGDGWDGDC